MSDCTLGEAWYWAAVLAWAGVAACLWLLKQARELNDETKELLK